VLPANRAAELLRRIQAETAERSQLALLLPFILQAITAFLLGVLVLVGAPGWAYAAGLIVGQTVLAALLIRAMARIDSEIAGGLARAGLVQAASARIVEFHVPEWHIVGAE
jgi:hypothetical protein